MQDIIANDLRNAVTIATAHAAFHFSRLEDFRLHALEPSRKTAERTAAKAPYAQSIAFFPCLRIRRVPPRILVPAVLRGKIDSAGKEFPVQPFIVQGSRAESVDRKRYPRIFHHQPAAFDIESIFVKDGRLFAYFEIAVLRTGGGVILADIKKLIPVSGNLRTKNPVPRVPE